MNVSKSRKLLLLSMVLFVVTAALYWPTTHHDFSVFDDEDYVRGNPWVNEGVSWEATQWAFTTFWAANWHPLTWLSHQADCSMFGMFAGGHHLTNLLLHALNTLLVFLLLRKMTGSTGRSWIVAALFGCHPLRVESVAWIAERKDLLSTFFLLVTIFAYWRYAKARAGETDSQPRCAKPVVWYCGALLMFAAGLLCKPMIVTVPFLLLLLDVWPLQRLEITNCDIDWRNGRRLVLEKIPFFALAFAGCVVTLAAQHAGGAVKNTQQVSMAMRVCGALSGYAEYLYQTFWPSPLCIFYPLPERLPIIAAIIGVLLLLGGTIIAVRNRNQSPWLLAGWFWFVGALVPVIGFVQVGLQAHADRYTYIPSIGLYVALVWGAHQVLQAWPNGRKIGLIASATCLVACLALTEHQLGFWQDSVKLFSHSLAHTRNNGFAQNNLGVAYARMGKAEEAKVHYREAIRLSPNEPRAYYNLGTMQASEGDLQGACATLSTALQFSPHNESLLNNLGVVLAEQGKYSEALARFQEAILHNPSYPKSYLNAAIAYQALGQAGPAFTNYMTAMKMEPFSIEVRHHLAYLLATCPDAAYRQPQQALQLAQQAANLSGNFVPECLQTLALAYAVTGDFTNAIAVDEHALKIAQNRPSRGYLEKTVQSELAAYKKGAIPERDWKRLR